MATSTQTIGSRTVAPTVHRVGSVSYLNAKPLIYGLEADDDIRLSLEVPSRLLAGLESGEFDVALLPVIDYQRFGGLRLLLSGGIGSNGATLTVRIFSAVPIREIQCLACDTDSHTSVALARIILAERYDRRPEFIPLSRVATNDQTTARLLIGDKVVCEEPQGLPHQIDLGHEWKELTGLPFVFAAWIARAGVRLGDLSERLRKAKARGLANVDEIIARHALPRGWPADVARRYLTQHLEYDITPRHLQAIALFHELAARHGLVRSPPRPIELAR